MTFEEIQKLYLNLFELIEYGIDYTVLLIRYDMLAHVPQATGLKFFI